MVIVIALLCGVMGLVWWFDQHYRAWKVKRVAAAALCEKEGHLIERIYAFDHPAYPVDNCTRCPYQKSIRYWCPHCKEEIKYGSTT